MRLIGATELVDANKRGIEQVFRNVVAYDQTESLPDITVPTLLLWGEEDVAVPVRIAKEMRELIPNSKLEILPSLGHNMHIENADLTYGKIKNFIRQVS